MPFDYFKKKYRPQGSADLPGKIPMRPQDQDSETPTLRTPLDNLGPSIAAAEAVADEQRRRIAAGGVPKQRGH